MFALALLCWLLASLLVMSFVEHFVHKHLMHRRRLPAWLYRLVPFLDKVAHQHAKLHHRRYYRRFDFEPDPHGRHLDIHLDLWLGMALAAPVGLGLCAFGCVLGGAVFFLTVVAHHLVWNLVHEEMHIPTGRWFARTRAYRFLARYHEQHHRYAGRNFNVVLPFADYLLGAHMPVSALDERRMKQLGL